MKLFLRRHCRVEVNILSMLLPLGIEQRNHIGVRGDKKNPRKPLFLSVVYEYSSMWILIAYGIVMILILLMVGVAALIKKDSK